MLRILVGISVPSTRMPDPKKILLLYLSSFSKILRENTEQKWSTEPDKGCVFSENRLSKEAILIFVGFFSVQFSAASPSCHRASSPHVRSDTHQSGARQHLSPRRGRRRVCGWHIIALLTHKSGPPRSAQNPKWVQQRCLIQILNSSYFLKATGQHSPRQGVLPGRYASQPPEGAMRPPRPAQRAPGSLSWDCLISIFAKLMIIDRVNFYGRIIVTNSEHSLNGKIHNFIVYFFRLFQRVLCVLYALLSGPPEVYLGTVSYRYSQKS